MSSGRDKNRRRNILSDPKSQIRLMGFFIVLVVVYAVLNVYISKRAFNSMVVEVQSLPMPAQSLTDASIMASSHEDALNLQLTLFTVLMGVMMVLASLAVSHRVSGPMTHMRIYLRGVMNGTVEPRLIKFRKNDFFHDVAELFNEFQRHQGILKDSEESKSS